MFTISPETAEKWTEPANLFEGQRKIREKAVKVLAEEIRRGKFYLSPDAIVLIKGKLANGQHRLSAVAEAGIPCEFLVMETDDENLYKIFDCGKARSIADVLQQTEYVSETSACATQVVQYDKWNLTSHGVRGIMTRSERIDFCEQNKSTIDLSVRFAKSMHDRAPQSILTVKNTSSFLEIAGRENRKEAEKFIYGIFFGTFEDGTQIPPIINQMRTVLLKNFGSRKKRHGSNIFGLLIKSYNAYRNNETKGNLKLSTDERFPRFFFDTSINPREAIVNKNDIEVDNPVELSTQSN